MHSVRSKSVVQTFSDLFSLSCFEFKFICHFNNHLVILCSLQATIDGFVGDLKVNYIKKIDMTLAPHDITTET